MSETAATLEPVSDRAWLRAFVIEHWGAPGVVSRGRLWTGDALKAIRAVDGEEVLGLVSWAEEPTGWEVVTINALKPRRGIGTHLVETLVELARRGQAQRLWAITTNDNLDALRFFQRRGFRIAGTHLDVVAESRRLKPGIPERGCYGIAIRDEIELEYPL